MTLCFFTSCKPTPEDDIVITHSQKEFEEAIMMKAENIDKIECPSYYLDEFMSKDNKVTISFDAEVIIPEVTKFPVIKINPSPISKEMTKWAIDEFMEGNEGYYASMSLNKEEIEDWILRLQADLAEEDVENAKDILSSKIDAYKQMLIDASVDEPQIPTNLVFRPFSFYVNYDYQSKETELNMTSEELTERENNEDLNLYLQSDVELSNGLYARLTIYNEFPFSLNNRNVESVFGMEMYQIHIVYSYIPLSTDKTYILEPEPFGYLAPSGSLDSRYPDIIISEQEALEIAQKKLADMGIEDYYIEYCESRMGNEDIYNYRNYKSDLEGNLISF